MNPDIRRAPQPPADDRGSMALATLVILIGMSLSVLLVPIVGAQVSATRVDAERHRALSAAQAGIDIAMAQLRAGADPTGENGALEKLPSCDLSGDVSPGGSVPSMRYRVTVAYYDADDKLMSCPPMDTPKNASLTSTGAGLATGGVVPGARGSRTTRATYRFSWENTNIIGGAIRITKSGTPLCIDAGTDGTPLLDAPARMLGCQAGASQQRFAYTKDQNIRLVGSESVAELGGWCLDGRKPPNVVFRPCGKRIPQQRWSLDAVTDIYSTSDGISRGWPCLDVDVAMGNLMLGACGSNQGRSLNLDTSVGAGMADATTGQLVNYKEFNRCVDVPGGNPDSANMIGWYCHQAPDGNFQWNQRWAIPTPVPPAVSATGRIRTVKTPENPVGTGGHCLRSPLSVAANQWVDAEPCTTTSVLGPGMLWTVYADTGTYATSYRIMDEQGFCFTFTGDLKTRVATCSAATLQKWNAKSDISRPSPLIDISED
jgi:hypothetical protein